MLGIVARHLLTMLSGVLCVFFASQRDNQERKERGKAHIELQFMDYTSHSHVDLATVCTPRTVTKETTAHEIELCETYAVSPGRGEGWLLV